MGKRPVSLSNALFSSTQQRVLALLFGQPDRSFSTSEIIARANAGSGAVQRELARLAGSGLATVSAVGNQRRYQANPRCPIFEEIRGIVEKTFGLAGVLRAALAPLEEQIHAAFVYGSVAKQQDTAASDIDLLIVSDTVSYGDLFLALEEAGSRLVRTINPTIYTEEEWTVRLAEGSSFLSRVLEQPLIWLIGGEDAVTA